MPASPSPVRRLRQFSLGSSMLAGLGFAGLGAAQAAQLAVAAQSYYDPMMLNLAIPASAPQTGMWSTLQNWPLVAIHSALLPSGKIVTYGAPQGQSVQDGRTYDVWDPSQGFGAGHVVLPGVTGVNSFCAAQTFRADGSLMISGGILDNNQDKGSVLLNNTATTITGSGAQLAADRYYASMITQADGSALIMGGSYPYAPGWTQPQQSINSGWFTGMTPEVYTPAGGWRSLFGATSRNAFGPDNERFWYPHAWVAPNGKTFGISSDNMWYLDATGSGSITTMAFKAPPHQPTSSADVAPNTGPTSTAVLFDRGKILQAGGNSMTNIDGTYPSSNSATIIDITGASPVMSETAPMTYPRDWANSTLLPTGTVLVTGGSKNGDQSGGNAVYATETWDPATGRWTVGPSASAYRGYHSSAILLQSGAVLTAGGGIPGPVSNMNAEVYYPPYLFTTVNGQAQLAPRPQIVSLSSNQLSHGQSVQIEMSNTDAMSQVVLVGLSEVTHSFNSGQRRFVTQFSQNGAILTAQLPNSPNDAPPGYYQVIAINGNGVPSVGAIVALGSQVATPTATTMPIGSTVPRTGISATSTGATTWQKCADENGTCALTGTQQVRFGANNAFYYGSFTGSVTCNTGTFGEPAYGIVKACYIGSGQAASSAGQSSGSSTVATSASIIQAPSTGNWQQVGVASQRVASASDGTTAVVNSANGSVWLYNGSAYSQLPGALTDIAIVKAGSIYGIGTDTNVYRYNGSGFTQIGVTVSSIGASADGTIAVVSSNANTVWVKTSDDFQANWKQIPNVKMKKVAPMNAGAFYGVGMDDNVYRFDAQGNLSQIGVNAIEIAASSDGSIVVTNKYDQNVWVNMGSGNWTSANKAALAVAAPVSGRQIIVGLDHNVYRW